MGRIGKAKRAVTLIELVITIVILALIGSASVAFFIPMMHLFFYSPSQLMVDNVAQDVAGIIIEGDDSAKGLRFSKSITSADEDEITFTNTDNDTIAYRWDATEKKVFRNINNTGESTIPYSYYKNVIVKGSASDSEIFQYYDSSASKIAVPVVSVSSIESIRMNLIIKAGPGNVEASQGSIKIETGIDIKQY